MAPTARSIADRAQWTWVILSASLSGFSRDQGTKLAAGMAFYAMLAMIPALFLLTLLFGAVVGSSQEGLHRARELAAQFIPRYSEVLLGEVERLARHGSAFGLANFLALAWGITPFAASVRGAFDSVLHARRPRPYLLEKLLDLALVVLFVLGLSAAALAGVGLRFVERATGADLVPLPLEVIAPFALIALTVLALQAAFTRGVSLRHLAAGALTTAALWLLARPAFTLFLTYNEGFGVAFGSFKSVFTVVVWIYWSCVVLLLGAEVSATLHRREAIVIGRLLEGRGKRVPASVRERHVRHVAAGTTLFSEGEPGREMYYVLEGSVSVRVGGDEVAVVPPRTFVGEMSFLLGAPRTASAVAGEDSTLVAIDNANIELLMRESPALIRAMLAEMAGRLRETTHRRE